MVCTLRKIERDMYVGASINMARWLIKFNTDLLNELDRLKEKIIDLKELTPEILSRFVERIKIKAYGTPKSFIDSRSHPFIFRLFLSIPPSLQ